MASWVRAYRLGDKVVTAKDQREGLILVVPMLKNKNITATNHWNAADSGS